MMQVIPQWWWACLSTSREPHVDLDNWKPRAIVLMHFYQRRQVWHNGVFGD